MSRTTKHISERRLLTELELRLEKDHQFALKMLKVIIKVAQDEKNWRMLWEPLCKVYVELAGFKPHSRKSHIECIADLAEKSVKRWGGQNSPLLYFSIVYKLTYRAKCRQCDCGFFCGYIFLISSAAIRNTSH